MDNDTVSNDSLKRMHVRLSAMRQDVLHHVGPNQRLVLLIAVLMACRLWLYGQVAGAFTLIPTALCRWDCNWYLSIAQAGYEAQPKSVIGATFGQANWAFLPVYPLLVRAMHVVTRLPYHAAAVAVSNLAFCLFVFVSAKYLKQLRPETSGAALVVFLFAVPSSFYFSLPYTESVFAVLTMTILWLLRQETLPGAAAVAAVLSAVKVTGIVFTPIIAARYLARIGAAWRRRDRAAMVAEVQRAVLPIAIAPLGLFLYMAYLYHHVGDAFGFIHIQRAWGRSGADMVSGFIDGLFAFDLNMVFSHRDESTTLNALAALCGLAVCFRLWRLGLMTECLFLTAGVLLPVSHGLASVIRYVFAEPIFLVFLFDLIWSTHYRRMFREIILFSIFLELFLVHMWIQQYAIF